MKSNIQDALENRLSVNSYLWPKNIDPYEFIETILKAGIKNIGLHVDFIEEFGVNKLKQELNLNKINVTSINSVGYFTDNFYFKQHEKIFNYAKILKPDVVCVISGGILGGPNPISSEYNFENKNLNIERIRKESLNQLLYLFKKAQEQNQKITDQFHCYLFFLKFSKKLFIYKLKNFLMRRNSHTKISLALGLNTLLKLVLLI